MKHAKYLSYVVRHKWFVLCACWRRGLYWQGIIHDWSKFLPSEWFPYAQFFYGEKFPEWSAISAGQKYAGYPYELTATYVRHEFDRAWLKHQHRSPHHWQHWILREDSGATNILEMPIRYATEMVCDWEGAGRAITGKTGGTVAWYLKNEAQIQLHPTTRRLIEQLLGMPTP